MSVRTMIDRYGFKVTPERLAETVTPAMGRADASYVSIREEVMCWPQPAKADLVETFKSKGVLVTHTIYLYEDPQVDQGCRLRGNGRIFAVAGAENCAELGRLFVVTAREVLNAC